MGDTFRRATFSIEIGSTQQADDALDARYDSGGL